MCGSIAVGQTYGMADRDFSLFDSRQRAEEAFTLRASRYSWNEICKRLGYRSVGAAQTAVNRHVSRERKREVSAATIAAHKQGIEIRCRAMSQRFVAAYKAGDDNTMIALNREITRNEAELAKLGGMYAPERQEVGVTVTADLPALLDQVETALLERDRQRQLMSGNIIDAELIE